MVDFFFYSSTSNCSLFVIVLVIQLFWMLMFMILSSLGWLVKYYELGSHIWASNFILKIGAPFVFFLEIKILIFTNIPVSKEYSLFYFQDWFLRCPTFWYLIGSTVDLMERKGSYLIMFNIIGILLKTILSSLVSMLHMLLVLVNVSMLLPSIISCMFHIWKCGVFYILFLLTSDGYW